MKDGENREGKMEGKDLVYVLCRLRHWNATLVAGIEVAAVQIQYKQHEQVRCYYDLYQIHHLTHSVIVWSAQMVSRIGS